MRVDILIPAVCILWLVGCSNDAAPTQPELLREPFRLSRDQVAGVSVSLTIASATVTPGETVYFTVSAHNSTNRQIQIGLNCGPAIDIIVTQPDGTQMSVLAGRLFSCELGPQHFAGPGETKTEHLEWQAPMRSGEYIAVAGLQRGDGPSNLSDLVHFAVFQR